MFSLVRTLLFRTLSVYVVRWSWTPRSSSPSGLGSDFSMTKAARCVVALSEAVLTVPAGAVVMGSPLASNLGTYRGSVWVATFASLVSVGTILMGTEPAGHLASKEMVKAALDCRSVALLHTRTWRPSPRVVIVGSPTAGDTEPLT